MPGYTYKGSEPYKPPRAPGGRPPTGPWLFNPDKCGTNAGYHQHNRHEQKPCLECNEAHKAYDAEYRAKRKAAGFKRNRA
jgi:hypothetical protein